MASTSTYTVRAVQEGEMMNPTPLNPDALEIAVQAFQKNANAYMQALYTSDEVIEDAITAYLAVAQPEVNSDTELHVGTLIEDKTGQQLWNVWRTGGPAVHWVDDEGRPATPVFPARILYRPEVDDA